LTADVVAAKPNASRGLSEPSPYKTPCVSVTFRGTGKFIICLICFFFLFVVKLFDVLPVFKAKVLSGSSFNCENGVPLLGIVLPSLSLRSSVTRSSNAGNFNLGGLYSAISICR